MGELKSIFDHIHELPTSQQALEIVDILQSLIDELCSAESEDDINLYASEQDGLCAVGIFQLIVRALYLAPMCEGNKMDIYTQCYTLLQLLCIGNQKNKAICFKYLEDFVAHVTLAVECDACIREIFNGSPNLAAQVWPFALSRLG